MITCTRIFEFDSAHRVLGHEGHCRHLHGHRYRAEVTVTTPGRLDSLGRVIDFSVLKDQIGKWIDTNWDHNIILHPDDPLLAIHEVEVAGVFAGKKPFVMVDGGLGKWNPTAENLAMYLFIIVSNNGVLRNNGIVCENVRMWETPNCYADYRE